MVLQCPFLSMRFIKHESMKTKLTPNICYLAGIQSKWTGANNSVGVTTVNKETEQRFVEIAVNDLGVPAEKIHVTEANGRYTTYFFHSRTAKMLEKIKREKLAIFKNKKDLVGWYVAGMIDAAGKLTGSGLQLKIESSDALLLENMGIHTSGQTISNLRDLIEMLGSKSAYLSSLPSFNKAAKSGS